jgi:predicted nucleic acid-binding protein
LKSSVLDGSAVIAFLFQESGHEKVVALFEKAAECDKALLMPASSWAEIRSMIERKMGQAVWQDVRSKLLGLPLEIVPVDEELAEIAGEIQATKTMPLVDCFTAALAKQRKVEVYTSNPEFAAVDRASKIVWL